METYDMLANVKEGGTFLLNSPFAADQVWEHIPVEQQQKIIDKKLKFYVIDAAELARKTGMGKRINTVMQAAYFKLANVLPEDEAVKEMKHFIEKSYGRKGKEVVEKNYASIDAVREVEGAMESLEGDKVPVSKIPADGTFPSGTTQYEKRAVAERVPEWKPENCLQCGQCAMVCSHACIRSKLVSDADAAKAPAGFKTAGIKPKGDADKTPARSSRWLFPPRTAWNAACASTPARRRTRRSRGRTTRTMSSITRSRPRRGSTLWRCRRRRRRPTS
jgi:pyruvate-ferredoxin/flavodoxin oxidoreductase